LRDVEQPIETLQLAFDFQGLLQELVTGCYSLAVHLKTALCDDQIGEFRCQVHIGLFQCTFVNRSEIFRSGGAFPGGA
jgi:hypothetical protein